MDGFDPAAPALGLGKLADRDRQGGPLEEQGEAQHDVIDEGIGQ
jgi:hypothetical protein